jgi:hypothetical protein
LIRLVECRLAYDLSTVTDSPRITIGSSSEHAEIEHFSITIQEGTAVRATDNISTGVNGVRKGVVARTQLT